MGIAAAGKWAFAPRPVGVSWLPWYPAQGERRLELGQTVIEWAWMLLVLLLPAWLHFIRPPAGERRALNGKDQV